MCMPKSGLVLKGNLIYLPYDTDSHDEMIKDKGFRDESPFPNFVKIEIYPDDKNYFNHNAADWKLYVDQDVIPEWFDFDKVQKELREEELPKWWKERFIIDRKIEKIIKGIWYIGKNGVVQDVWGNGVVRNVWNKGVAILKNKNQILMANNSKYTLITSKEIDKSE